MIPNPQQLTGVLFHITPSENARSIEESGVNPKFSKDKMQSCWYCTAKRIPDFLLHLSMRHHLPVDHFSVCACLVEWEQMKRTGYKGIFRTYEIYRPESITPAEFFLSIMQAERGE